MTTTEISSLVASQTAHPVQVVSTYAQSKCRPGASIRVGHAHSHVNLPVVITPYQEQSENIVKGRSQCLVLCVERTA